MSLVIICCLASLFFAAIYCQPHTDSSLLCIRSSGPYIFQDTIVHMVQTVVDGFLEMWIAFLHFLIYVFLFFFFFFDMLIYLCSFVEHYVHICIYQIIIYPYHTIAHRSLSLHLNPLVGQCCNKTPNLWSTHNVNSYIPLSHSLSTHKFCKNTPNALSLSLSLSLFLSLWIQSGLSLHKFHSALPPTPR